MNEAALESQLKTLESIGAFLPCNCISIEHLLNPIGENNISLQIQSNEEIFAAVQEEHNLENSKDTRHQSPEPQIPWPSEKEMCSLISWALWYLEDAVNADSNKLSDAIEDYQQKLMTSLHFDGRQAGIEDYFKPATIKSAPKPPVASTLAWII